MKILIVDDNPTNRKLLRLMLEAEGFKVAEAEHGLAALEVLEHEEIRAIVSDVFMPQMDGYRLCYEVRRSDRFGMLPFIIYSSTSTSPADEELTLQLGADRFIAKPASWQVIRDALRELLEGRIRFVPPRRDPETEVEILKQYGERLADKLEQQSIELQASEERYRTLAETVPDRRQAELLRSSLSVSFSHELHTPLTVILGFLDGIRSNLDSLSHERLREMLDVIHGSSKRLHRLVERNLDFAQVEMLAAGADVETLRGEETKELGTFVRNLTEPIAGNHERAGDLKLDLTNGCAPLHPRSLARLLAELLDNAFKFSPVGTPVHVATRLTPQGLELSVQDMGRGMSPQQIASIGAFVQFDREPQGQQGVGLGLYLARRISQLYGGSLAVESVAGQGTTVTLRLPQAGSTGTVGSGHHDAPDGSLPAR